LLDLSRLDADALEIQPETIRVRERVEQVVAASGAREIEVDVPSELEVTLDANVFERVLSNLVTNAVRYGRPPVFVRAEQRDVDFHLAVEDRGAGVPPEFVPSLFERFARSDESRRLVAGGTGLGLAIARAYAHAHGGVLRYERASPTGARFELVVPVRR
jgi:signal transduction histidine kinase